MNLPVDTDVSIKTKLGKYQGFVQQVESDSLDLLSSEAAHPGRRWIFRQLMKDQILEVRLNQRMMSALVGGAIGIGIGVGLGAIADARSKSNEDRGLMPMALGIVGGAIGSAVGKCNPFIKGERIYKAP